MLVNGPQGHLLAYSNPELTICCCFVVVVGLLVRCDSSACGLYVVCVHVSGDRSFRFVDLRLVRAFARV